MAKPKNIPKMEDDLADLYHECMHEIEDGWSRIIRGAFKVFKLTESISEHIAYEYLPHRGVDEGCVEVGGLLRYCNGKRVKNALLLDLIEDNAYYIARKSKAIENEKAAVKRLEDQLYKAEMDGHEKHRRDRFVLVQNVLKQRGLSERMIRFIDEDLADNDYETYAQALDELLLIFVTKKMKPEKGSYNNEWLENIMKALKENFASEMKKLKLK